MAADRFQGKVAVISGSSSDPSIGHSCAVFLAREGAAVVVNGRSADNVEATVRALRAEGLTAAGVVGSAEDDAVVRRLAETAAGEYGRIDLVVNTIGGTRGTNTPLKLTREGLLETVALNTWPTLSLIQETMKHGLGEGGGAVVNISSGTVLKTTPGMAAYAAGKSALNALTRTTARSLAPYGVRVNGVAPGFTKTSGTKPWWQADDGAAAGRELLLGRMTDADDIAHAVLFLLSDHARAITGVVVDVDGGNHLQSSWSPMPQDTD